MLNTKHVLLATVVALGSMSSLASADSQPRYVERRISFGPRPDQHVLVRARDAKRADRPYALTGDTSAVRSERAPARLVPLHPKGTHGSY